MPLTIDDVPDSFVGQFLKKNINATVVDIIKAYEEQQGKQAMNTRLLEMHYDMRWGWDIEHS